MGNCDILHCVLQQNLTLFYHSHCKFVLTRKRLKLGFLSGAGLPVERRGHDIVGLYTFEQKQVHREWQGQSGKDNV